MANRNKLIEAFISNLSTAIVHQVLEKAIDINEISERYNKEVKNSWEIAKKYREKINPADKSLPGMDADYIKKKVTNKAKTELKLRIERGYENISLFLVEEFVEKAMKELAVAEPDKE